MFNWPVAIKIRDVSLRDGLQNEKIILTTVQKKQIIEMLLAAGIQDMEITSFVDPRRVPQMADAEELVARAYELAEEKGGGVHFSALVGNRRGLERALQTAIAEVVWVVSASPTHQRINMGRPAEEVLAELPVLVATAVQAGRRVRGAVAAAFGCAYEGKVSPEQVLRIVEGMYTAGVREITLADTAGCADPATVAAVLAAVGERYCDVNWALHLHDTRGWALSNAVVGLAYGISVWETAIGGLGGCPFMPGAEGNLATEKLVSLVQAMGINCPLPLTALQEAAARVKNLLGHSSEA